MDRSSVLYQFIAKINQYRQKMKFNLYEQVESYCDNDIYAFFRGPVWVGVTNKYGKDVTKTIGYHPFRDGSVICNILDTSDCLTIQQQAFKVVLSGGNPKIYIEKD